MRGVRPFLKSNSRLRMPGRAGSTIFLRSLLRPSLTLLWDSLRQVSRNSLKDRKDAVFQLKTSSPSRLKAHRSFRPKGVPE